MNTVIDDLIYEIDKKLGDKPLIPLPFLMKLGLAKSPTALHNMIARGDLQAIRLGGRYLVPRKCVLDMVRKSFANSQENQT